MGEDLHAGEEKDENGIRDGDRRDERRQRLAQQELLAADRCREYRFEGALLTLADYGGGSERGWYEGQHGQQDMLVGEPVRCRRGLGEDCDQWLEEKDQREDDHGEDDVAVAAVFAELLAVDGPHAALAHAHLRLASWPWSISSR